MWLNADSSLLLKLQMVYNAVLDAHISVIAAMEPGVSWPVSNHAIMNQCWQCSYLSEPAGCAICELYYYIILWAPDS